MLEKTLDSPLDCKESKPVNTKGNQPWIFIERTDTEAGNPIFWPHDAKNWLIGKDPDAGKDRWQEEKKITEDEMVGWHHRLDGHEFEQAPGDGGGQGSMMSMGSQRVVYDWVTELNWRYAYVLCIYHNEYMIIIHRSHWQICYFSFRYHYKKIILTYNVILVSGVQHKNLIYIAKWSPQ